MGKLERFKKRASRKGQSVTIYPFSANPSGDYIDPDSGLPDPEDPDYPETPPEVTYGDPVTVMGFVQDPIRGERGERYVVRIHGKEFPVDKVVFLPGDQAITSEDKIVYGSTDFEVLEIKTYKDGDTVVFREVLLEKMTA